MIHKLKTLILSLSLLFSFSAPVVVAGSSAFALTQQQINQNLCNGSNLDVSGSNSSCSSAGSGTTATQLLAKVINILSVLVGALAVIMIIIGGFRYVTSGGNDSATAGAKKTILYALIGLVIVAFAQLIVHFVLNNIS